MLRVIYWSVVSVIVVVSAWVLYWLAVGWLTRFADRRD